jgi:DNA-binding SARP family transcriptional activator
LSVQTEPEDASALRHVGAMLYGMALECSTLWPDWPESPTRVELKAALADLRHLKGFLTAVGREHEVSTLAAPDVVLSQLAAEKARELDRIAEELERRLEGEEI